MHLQYLNLCRGDVYRAVCSTDTQEANEEIDQMETSGPNRTLEKLQSDWFKMKNNLMALQQVRMSIMLNMSAV